MKRKFQSKVNAIRKGECWCAYYGFIIGGHWEGCPAGIHEEIQKNPNKEEEIIQKEVDYLNSN